MPSLPEMLYGDNVLRIQHTDHYGIEFNAIDALKKVNNMEDTVKVACAQEWQESRAESEHAQEVLRPFDWTFTTDYRGTLLGEELQIKAEERIDIEKLKAREHIMFFEEVLLFEDELHDHAMMLHGFKSSKQDFTFGSWKVTAAKNHIMKSKDIERYRVMPSSFFLLQRFFLRVDGVLIRINDTRVYYENIPAAFYTDPNEIAQHLTLRVTKCEKLELPVMHGEPSVS
ncbi:hypothetical protein CCH79_00017620, partial [Gambusia affinis]